jgi:gamma-glutamylcyclotransferase (GGCT)/AIG2-like uncharacterized protein YtfP
MRGLLYDLGPYPAAVQIGCTDQWFQGYTLEIKMSELIAELDPFEQLDQGVYRRIRAVTEAGFEVWIYEYARPLGLGAIGPIHRWPPLPCGGS